MTTVEIGNGVTSIGNYAFESCSALTTVEIGNSVTSIGEDAFSSCSALTSVYITDLSAWCKIDFSNYSSNPLSSGEKLYLNDDIITELVIPDDVTKIKPYTFSGCSSISEITIPDHVTSIGGIAFSYCDALTTVKLGNGVTSIGTHAFYDCSIKTCYCYASTPPYLTGSDSFYTGVEEGATLYVPARTGSAYKSSNWGRYFTNIVEMD